MREGRGSQGKFEKFLIDTFGEKVDNVVMSAVMVFSIFMAIAIFMVLRF